MGFQSIPYILSQYLWLLVAAITLLSLIQYFPSQTTKDFFSSTTATGWNSSSTPTWMVHATDIHLSTLKNNSYSHAYNVLNNALSIIKPQKLIISGDIVDNTANSTFMPYQHQVQEDWNLYSKLITALNLTSDTLVQVAGNHDVYDLYSFDSTHNYGKNILYNSSDHVLSTQTLQTDSGKIGILALNPYEFPTPPVMLTWWTTTPASTLKEIINATTNPSADWQIIATHHPALMWFPNYGASRDNVFASAITGSTNVRFMLCGHMHPAEPYFYHHGDTLEVVGVPLFKYNKVGLLTIDNKRGAYHLIDLDSYPFAVMTNPAPMSQTSSLDVFNQKSSEIRALAFAKNPPNLTVSGAVNGKLNCTREIEEEVFLCSLPMNLSNGVYTLNKSGDWNGSVNFIIGDTLSGFSEKVYFDEPSISYIFLFWLFEIICLALTIPIKFKNIGKDFELWVKGDPSQSHWIFAVVGGFAAVHERLSQAANRVRWSVFIAAIWPLFLPNTFCSIDYKFSMFWTWGIACSGKTEYMFQGMQFGLWYLIYVVLSEVLMTSAFVETRGKKFIFIVDAAVYLGAVYGIGYWLYELCVFFGVAYGLTSPMFMFIPVICHGIMIQWAISQIIGGGKSIDGFQEVL